MSSRPHRALTLAAALALLAPAVAPAASLVQLNFTGTSSYNSSNPFDSTSSSGTESYAASVTYDPAATATSPGAFPMVGYSGYNSGFIPFSAEVEVHNDITVAGFTDPVDVLTFTNVDFAFAGLPIEAGNTITLTTTADFLAGLQLPSLADFQSAIADHKILAASADGGAAIFNPFGGGFGFPIFGYTASIDTVAAVEGTAVPTPAAACAALPLLALTALTTRQRRARA